jgi:hypothetical protein
MSASTVFKPGDRVRHADCPDWGPGVVESAKPITHEGAPAWQLVVRFEQKGRVTVQTQYARIMHESHKQPIFAAPPKNSQGVTIGTGGYAAAMGAGLNDGSALIQLPEALSDIFAPLEKRLALTLDLYRYSVEARSLFEWATLQSGLADPLSRFSRHELESAFGAWAKKRDTHLRDLVVAIRKAGRPELFLNLPANVPPAGRNALLKAQLGSR